MSAWGEGSGGGGGGGGLDTAAVQALINATNLSALQGLVTDAQIPAAIMRDAELTAAAVRTLLGLSATEVNDLLTGATITGQVITFTQNDGTTATVTIPAGTGGVADGVVDSGSFNALGTELTLMTDTGEAVVISVPALLRGGGSGATFTSGTADPTGGAAGDIYYQVTDDDELVAVWWNVSGAWTEYNIDVPFQGSLDCWNLRRRGHCHTQWP